MKDEEIIDVINKIEKQYKSYMDGGSTFIKFLAKKVQNCVDEEKKEILVFFLKELEFNGNGFFSIALNAIVEMNEIQLAPEIENIYIKNRKSKGEEWNYSIIEALMKLNYTKPKSLYFDFIEEFLKKNPSKSYFILVRYYAVDNDRGLQLLVNYFSQFFIENIEMRDFIESRIGFLVDNFIKTSDDSIAEFVKLVSSNNKIAGRYLKKVFLNYFDSNIVSKYSEILVENEKKILNSLEI